MKREIKWQAWASEGSTVFAPLDRIDSLRAEGSLDSDATLLFDVVAATGEQAMTQYHQRMGWEPYRPQGEPRPCPHRCGGQYYPLGYGQCPNCGDIE